MGSENDEIFKNECWRENQDFMGNSDDFSQDTIHLCNDPIHKKERSFYGVRKSATAKPVPRELAIERNLIRVPICVASQKTATLREFVYEFAEKVVDGELCVPKLIISSGNTPLPLPHHAKVLDALLALLAHSFNEDGGVWFSFSDISQFLDTAKKDACSIREASRRYHYCTLYFQHCWVDEPGRVTSEAVLIIEQTDLFDAVEKIKNPRNSRKRENLHYVKFSPKIVESVKKNFIRLFPKEAFNELDAGTYTLYKLFYAPTDREPVRRTVDFIARFLGWGERIDRLRPWIVKHLEILQEKEFILWWRKKDDCFEVCSNALRFKKHIDELRRLDPMKAENVKIAQILDTRKKGKLKGDHVDNQTRVAKAEVKGKKTIGKSTVKDSIKQGKEQIQMQQMIASFANMTAEQRVAYISHIKSVSENDTNGLLSPKLGRFSSEE